MYVTRRLLRSTLPTEPEKEKKEVPFLPPPTPKRRAAVRACAKIGEVVADTSGPAARSRATKTSENAGDEKNKSRNHKKTKKEEKKHKETKVKEEAKGPTLDVTKLHGYQLMVDVHYRGEQYAEARVLDLDPNKELLFVHYMGWNARFDAWVELDVVAAHGSHSGAAKKKDSSWDGDTSLFATEEEMAAQKLNGKVNKLKTSKPKKQTAMSPKARLAARKALQSVSKKQSEDVVESDKAQTPAKRTVRKSPKNAKGVKKPRVKSPRAGKKVSAKTVSSPARRTPRRVQVAVGTTDEDSERRNNSETADLVLDVEIQGREASNDEVKEDDAEEEEEEQEVEASSRTKMRKSRRKAANESPGGSKRKRDTSHDDVEESARANRSPANKKKPKKSGAGNKSAAATKTAPLTPRSGRGGLGSTTREKLAAIFRLRVQQKQQMEQLNASQASFQQSLQDPAVDSATAAAADTTSSSAEAEKPKGNNITMVNAEFAAAEEYQRQLQQYYYHQQVMLVNSLSMSAGGGEDPSTIPLQGGILDPRIIQERLVALEQRRRQQAHVQAYYQQLMLTRERNVRALAANQAFMTASAAVWEQQLRETQSEDGTSSVTSWKDVTGAESSEMSKAELTTAAPDSEASESNKSDNESTKESETSSATAVAPETSSSDVARATSPDTVEKTAESSAVSTDTSPAKSVDPADPPTQGVLYEFVL